jgi:YaiO family outer membrane protein
MHKFLLFLLLSVLFLPNVVAQKANADSLYIVARQQAYSGNLEKARLLCDVITRDFPDYYNAYILKGKTFTWTQQFDSARVVLSKVYFKDPNNKNALSVMVDVEISARQYEQARILCNQALKIYPNEKDFLEKKNIALLALGITEEIKTPDKVEEKVVPKEKLIKLPTVNLQKPAFSNRLSVDYFNDQETVPYSRIWEMERYGYERIFASGRLISSVTTGHYMADGMSQKSNQYTLEGYRIFSDQSYSLISYGYSPDPIFPRHRIGLEYFKTMKNDWEASAGIRYLSFMDENNKAQPVQSFTLSVSKCFKKLWLSFRPYFTTITQGSANSYSLTTRYYLSRPNNYLSVEVATGLSPDDPKNYAGGYRAYVLKGTRFKVGIQQMMGRHIQGMVDWGIERHEYVSTLFRDDNIVHVRLSYLF